MKNILLILLLASASMYTYAQDTEQALRLKLKNAEPTEQVTLLIEFAEQQKNVDTKKSLFYAKEALELAQNIPQRQYLANAYHQLGNTYFADSKYETAIKHYKQELKLVKGIANNQRIYDVNYVLAQLLKITQNESAIPYFEKALDAASCLRDTEKRSELLYTLYIEYSIAKNSRQSQTYMALYFSLKDSLEQAVINDNKEQRIEAQQQVETLETEQQNAQKRHSSQITKQEQRYSSAITKQEELLKDHINKAQLQEDQMRLDSLNLSNEKDIAQNKVEFGIDQIEKRELVNAALQRDIIIIASIGILFLLLSVLVFILYRFKITANQQLTIQKQKIETQTNRIQYQNQQLVSSITYARRIQQAMLVKTKERSSILPQSFIYFKPRDIVSGDFYWVSSLGEFVIFAAIDCTGHGVPGAFMSLIANTLLNQIVNQDHETDPARILTLLHTKVIEELHNTGDNTSSDGMDMSLCSYHSPTRQLRYAGAKNAIYLFCNNKLQKLQANPFSVGMPPIRDVEVIFKQIEVTLPDNTMIYLYSDGYMDQVSEHTNKKFNLKKFKELLTRIAPLEIEEQYQIIDIEMRNWQGTAKQLDDMLVMGIRL